MTWQRITEIEVEEAASRFTEDTATLTLENADGETYTTEDDVTDDSQNHRGRKGNPENDLVQSRLNDAQTALVNGDEAWANVSFGQNAKVTEVRAGRPGELEE